MSPEFLVTTLIICVTPGIGVLYTLAAGLSRGGRASIVAAAACTLGIVPHIAAAITGAAALMHTSAVAFQTLKWLGVAYLLYMAVSTLREHGALQVDEEAAPRSTRAVLPGRPGTASSSSRLALRNASGEPKWLSSVRLRAGPIPGSSSSSDAVIARSRRLR